MILAKEGREEEQKQELSQSRFAEKLGTRTFVSAMQDPASAATMPQSAHFL